MECIIGKDKFPLIKFENDRYTHIFPVTKYQFERYIWESERAPDINYDDMLKTNPRISPEEVSKKKLNPLFITNITFREASDFARWMKGRLPVRDEIEVIYNCLGSIKVSNIFDSIKKSRDMDRRCSVVLSKMLSIFPHGTVKDIIENSKIEELCSTMSDMPSSIYTYTCNKHRWYYVGKNDTCDSRIEDAVFRVVIDKDNT